MHVGTRAGRTVMLWWYGGYVATLAALTAWYFGNLSTPQFVTPCEGTVMECGGSHGVLLMAVAVFCAVLLTASLVVSWVVLRLTAGLAWPAAVTGTAAALSGPLLVVLLGYLYLVT